MPDTLVALQKAIDAAIIGEPFATDAVQRGIAVLDVDDSKVAVGDLGSVLIFNTTFMKKRRMLGHGADDFEIEAAKAGVVQRHAGCGRADIGLAVRGHVDRICRERRRDDLRVDPLVFEIAFVGGDEDGRH